LKLEEHAQRIVEDARKTAATLESFLTENAPLIADLAAETVARIREGGKVIVFGNGGSAADAQHLAAEFVGRFLKERDPLPAIALTTNTSSLTAIGNDYGYKDIFARQLKAFAGPDDVVIGISTSGNSPNVVLALEKAREVECYTVGLTGEGGGRMEGLCDTLFAVKTPFTPRVQECHISLIHAFCDCVERLWVESLEE